jgi:hypothetical protein
MKIVGLGSGSVSEEDIAALRQQLEDAQLLYRMSASSFRDCIVILQTSYALVVDSSQNTQKKPSPASSSQGHGNFVVDEAFLRASVTSLTSLDDSSDDDGLAIPVGNASFPEAVNLSESSSDSGEIPTEDDNESNEITAWIEWLQQCVARCEDGLARIEEAATMLGLGLSGLAAAPRTHKGGTPGSGSVSTSPLSLPSAH